MIYLKIYLCNLNNKQSVFAIIEAYLLLLNNNASSPNISPY